MGLEEVHLTGKTYKLLIIPRGDTSLGQLKMLFEREEVFVRRFMAHKASPGGEDLFVFHGLCNLEIFRQAEFKLDSKVFRGGDEEGGFAQA